MLYICDAYGFKQCVLLIIKISHAHKTRPYVKPVELSRFISKWK